MSDQIIRYFSDCDIRYTKSEMSFDEKGKKVFKFFQVKKESVFIKTVSHKKSVWYLDLSDSRKWKMLRIKSLKIIGGNETTLEEINKIIETWDKM